MATQVQLRRGTTTQNNAFTGANGELSVDTDVKTIRIHDGLTAGGGSTLVNTTVAQTLLNKTFSTGNIWNGTPVPVGYGGTGAALTPVAGAVPYSTGSAMALTAAGTSGQVLVSGGTGSPVWVNASSVTAGSALTATTASNIAGGSAGQLLIQSDTDLTTFITAGDAGTFLQSAGAGYAPTWAAGQVTIGSTAVALGATETSFTGLDVLTATGHNHWKLPVGDTSQRPGSPSAGMVRYNTDTVGFEGYSSGAWSSLGGVSSVDKLTYIQAETSAGASNGELEFYAENAAGDTAVKYGGWNYTRLAVLNTTTSSSTSTGALVVSGGAGIAGNVWIGGTLNVLGDINTTSTTTLNVADTYLYLADGNSGNVLDTGLIVVSYESGHKHNGLVRVASTNKWRLFNGATNEPGSTVDFTGASDADLQVGILTSSTIDDTYRTNKSFTGTTSSTTPTAVLAVSSTTYRSGELTMQVKNGTAYRILKLFFVHDGTTVTLSENYLVGGEIQTADTATTFTSTISGGTLTVYATAASGTSVVKGEATLFKA